MLPFARHHNHRGMAILITLAIITLCISAALELNRRTRIAMVNTSVHQNEFRLFQIANSGLHLAMALLVKDKAESQIDSVQEVWSDQEKIQELLQEISFREGQLKLSITDESARIQVNALVTYPDRRAYNAPQIIIWQRFLEYIQKQQSEKEESMAEDSQPTAIINSIKDWIDTGDDEAVTGLSGAESDYYQSLDPPYDSRNGPIQHPDELLQIKGITPLLYWGDDDILGIRDNITVHGIGGPGGKELTYDGRININTAPLPVLVALLPPGYDDLAESLYELRTEFEDMQYTYDLSDPKWYKNMPGLGDVEIDAEAIKTSSDLFRIEAAANISKDQMLLTAIVKREQVAQTGKWRCRVISFNID
jgi:general secretion pathway protein K